MIELYIEDLNQDTLFYSKKIIVDVATFSIKEKRVVLDNVVLTDTHFDLKQHKNETENNLDFILNYFATADTTKSNWFFGIDKLNLHSTCFEYNNNNYEEFPAEVDYNHIKLSYLDVSLSNIKLLEKGVECKINELNFFEKSGFQLDGFSSNFRISPKGIVAKQLKIKTPYSNIDGNINFATQNYASLPNFIEEVKINSRARSSKLRIAERLKDNISRNQ